MNQIAKTLAAMAVAAAAACTPGTPPTAGKAPAPVADTIVYTVDLVPTDTADVWQADCLKGLDRAGLVDALFDAVYHRRAEVTDYFDNRPLTLEEVKDMEADPRYDRDCVERLLFWERWMFDAESLTFDKKTIKVMVAYAMRDDDGQLLGYRAGIVIRMNDRP